MSSLATFHRRHHAPLSGLASHHIIQLVLAKNYLSGLAKDLAAWIFTVTGLVQVSGVSSLRRPSPSGWLYDAGTITDSPTSLPPGSSGRGIDAVQRKRRQDSSGLAQVPHRGCAKGLTPLAVKYGVDRRIHTLWAEGRINLLRPATIDVENTDDS